MSTPATSGRRSSTSSAPPSSAAVMKPLWPCVTLTNTAGKASAGSQASARPAICRTTAR